jgi:hypothetical protein
MTPADTKRTESDMNEQLPLPDITKDRVACLIGAAIFVEADQLHKVVFDRLMVPMVPGAYPEGCWPKVRGTGLGVRQMVGTVDELVTSFRVNLEKAFHLLSAKKADGTYDVIPAMGAASLAPFQEKLTTAGIDCFPMTLPSGTLEPHDKAAQAMTGKKYELPAKDRARLISLLYTYSGCGYGKDTAQKLIAALQAYIADIERVEVT